MAWFGESLANITGQISNFTKEVLAEGAEEEDGGRGDKLTSEELKTTRQMVADLQTLCAQQQNEIEHFKLLSSGFKEKSDALDHKNKALVESFQKIIDTKDEENKRLESIIVESTTGLQETHKKIDVEADDKECQTEAKLEDENESRRGREVGLESEATTNNSSSSPPELCPIAVQTEDSSVETSHAETNTESVESLLEDAASKAEQESYLRELEERCSAYQNDLYILRGELMTLQSDVDQNEEARARLNEEIFGVLHCDFLLEGQSALPKLRYSGTASCNEGEQILLSALRQLAAIWRGLNDKKNSLERIVTKLSANGGQRAGPNSAPSVQIEELDEELPENEFPEGEDQTQVDCFPARLDSFGLETIIEEERNDEEFKPDTKEVPSKPEIEVSNSSTQTDPTLSPEEEGSNLRTELLASLEISFSEKENSWRETVETRDGKIHRLESELERLKNHLVDLEEQHTTETLVSEEKEKGLQFQIAELQKHINYLLQQSERSADSKEEISRIETDRNFIQAQCRSYEDQNQKLNSQLQNLNFVLEQFQKEKEIEIFDVKKQFQLSLQTLNLENSKLKDELQAQTELLEKARSGLDAAKQLNLQIEEKSRVISTLKSQVADGESRLMKLQSQFDEVTNSNVAKIDRYLIKNLIVGYFSTPPDKRQEVLRIIATVLDFNREDRQKTGLEATSSWPFKSESSPGKSWSEAFIQFLETESQPKVQIKLPMDEITRRHSRTPSESSTASGSGPCNTSGTSTHTTEISMNLPVLNQGDRSNSILKDVLNPRV